MHEPRKHGPIQLQSIDAQAVEQPSPMRDALESAPKQDIVIFGGAGAIGSGVVERCGSLGWNVAAVGRRPWEHLPPRTQELFRRHRVAYESLDLRDAAAEQRLEALLRGSCIAVNAAEPYPRRFKGIKDGVAAMRRLGVCAVRAGFVEKGEGARRFVRVGSAAAEIPTAGGQPEGRRPYDEDRPLGFFKDRGMHPSWWPPYFRAKLAIRRDARELHADAGLAVVGALPSAVISWWGHHGSMEAIPGYLDGRFPLYVLRWAVDALPVDYAAEGILLAALRGRCGESYRIGGAPLFLDDYIHAALQALGVERDRLPTSLRAPQGIVRAALAAGVVGTTLLRPLWTSSGKEMPVWMDPMFLALTREMRVGETAKAEEELGYRRPGPAIVLSAVLKSARSFLPWPQKDGASHRER